MKKTRSTNAGGAAKDDQKAVYKPTPIEAKAIEAYRAANDKHGPRLKVAVTGENSAEISTDHADPATGNVALMQAIGTTDFDFYCGLIGQLVNASKKGEAPEAGTNFMLAVIKGIEPRDQVEAMLAAQMAAVPLDPRTAGARHCKPLRFDLARHLDARCIGQCMGLNLRFFAHPHPLEGRVDVPDDGLAALGDVDMLVCRMHGAAGGAPTGNRNALKHG